MFVLFKDTFPKLFHTTMLCYWGLWHCRQRALAARTLYYLDCTGRQCKNAKKVSNSFQTRFLQVVTLTKWKLERAGKASSFSRTKWKRTLTEQARGTCRCLFYLRTPSRSFFTRLCCVIGDCDFVGNGRWKFHHKCSSKWQRNQCIDRLNGKLSKFVRKYNLKAHWKWTTWSSIKFHVHYIILTVLEDNAKMQKSFPIVFRLDFYKW
jgi:hypothetical protein